MGRHSTRFPRRIAASLRSFAGSRGSGQLQRVCPNSRPTWWPRCSTANRRWNKSATRCVLQSSAAYRQAPGPLTKAPSKRITPSALSLGLRPGRPACFDPAGPCPSEACCQGAIQPPSLSPKNGQELSPLQTTMGELLAFRCAPHQWRLIRYRSHLVISAGSVTSFV